MTTDEKYIDVYKRQVFCHEEKAKEIFDQKNEELCKDASAANSFANSLMPITVSYTHLDVYKRQVVSCVPFVDTKIQRQKIYQ